MPTNESKSQKEDKNADETQGKEENKKDPGTDKLKDLEIKLKNSEVEKANLENEKAKIELIKARAEAEKAAREASLPKGETKPLEGKIEADDKFGYVAELVAHHALQKCSQRISAQIDKSDKLPSNAKILIADTLNFAPDEYARIQVEKQFGIFEERFAAIREWFGKLEAKLAEKSKVVVTLSVLPGAVEVLYGATSVASLIADVAAYFRTDYNLKGREIKLNDEAIRVACGGKLTRPTYFFNFNLVAQSAIFETFKKMLDNRITIDIAKDQLEKRLKALSDESLKAEIQTAITEWQTLASAFDTYIKSIASSSDSQMPSQLAQAAMREHIHSNGITHLLYLKVVSSGGDAIMQKRIWGSAQTIFLGGCAVFFVLANKDGQLVTADMITEMSKCHLKLGDGGVSKIESVNVE